MKIKFLIKTLLTSIIFSIIIFIAAGKIDYFQGWLFLITNVISGVMNFWTIRNDEALMAERSNIGENAKGWDKRILGISSLVYLLNVVLAGLDSGRFHWSPVFPWSIYVLGLLLSLIGQAIFLTARNQNKYFSSVVRIQSDRGHTVCDTGLYKLVRHPGYLGMCIALCSVPMITGSIWSTITTAIAIVLLFVRTHLEDQSLSKELEGYTAYRQKTQYRLIPFIWWSIVQLNVTLIIFIGCFKL